MATAPTSDEQSTAQAVGRQLEHDGTDRLGQVLSLELGRQSGTEVDLGARVAEEGGSDVPTTWAVPR